MNTSPVLTSQATATNTRKPTWRIIRKPFYWTTIAMLIFILIDAMVEQIAEKSLLGLRHWLALRALDFILSLSVFLQSRKLEALLDEKENRY